MKLTNANLDALSDMAVAYRAELQSLLDECGGDREEFGRVLLRYVTAASGEDGAKLGV